MNQKNVDVWIGNQAGERREIEIKGVNYGFCWAPPGTFLMGSPEDEEGRCNDEFLHNVRLTRGFWMLETPVTQGLWTAIIGENPSDYSEDGRWEDYLEDIDTTNFPVENVSWYDCQYFIKQLNRLDLVPEHKFRLPTEAEWEYACRAGTKTPYWFGKELSGRQANIDERNDDENDDEWSYLYRELIPLEEPIVPHVPKIFLDRTGEVKSYAANPWGLYDVYGNVEEWTSDRYGAYPRDAADDPTGIVDPNVAFRVIRGGGWDCHAEYCRSASRDCEAPTVRKDYLGFRILLE